MRSSGRLEQQSKCWYIPRLLDLLRVAEVTQAQGTEMEEVVEVMVVDTEEVFLGLLVK